jgi:hypothetical protein
MVDIVYARGWDDCLEAVQKILEESEGIAEVRRKIENLQRLVKDKKFERIRDELGVFRIF